jgi:hypothetical protein
MSEKESLEKQIADLRIAILTLTGWLAQTHLFGDQDFKNMAKILKVSDDPKKEEG